MVLHVSKRKSDIAALKLQCLSHQMECGWQQTKKKSAAA